MLLYILRIQTEMPVERTCWVLPVDLATLVAVRGLKALVVFNLPALRDFEPHHLLQDFELR